MHGEEFNVPDQLPLKEIHYCDALEASYVASIQYCMHGNVYGFLWMCLAHGKFI